MPLPPPQLSKGNTMAHVSEIRGDQIALARVPAEATAGNADSWSVWRAPAKATVTSVRWIPDTVVTGVATPQ